MMSSWLIAIATLSLSAQPLDVSSVGWQQHLGTQLPLKLEFSDERGSRVSLERYFGATPVVLVFVYFSCPQLCPEVLAGVRESLQASGLRAGQDFRVIAVSIDPKDLPSQAAQQKSHLIAEESFRRETHFLTTPGDATAVLAQAAGFNYQYDAAHAQFAHAAGFLIADRRGTISRYFFGVRYAPDQVRAALIDAGQGRVGTFAERLRLLCYHFDPVQGRYSLAVMNLLRAFIVGCAVVVAAFVWRYRARERRAS